MSSRYAPLRPLATIHAIRAFMLVVGLYVCASPILAAPRPAPTPVPGPPPVTTDSIATLIARLGDVSKTVRAEAQRRLVVMPRKTVLDTAAALATGEVKLAVGSTQVFSPRAVALGLMNDWDDPRTGTIALAQLRATDGDLRESACAVVASLPDEQALPFLIEALGAWGHSSPGGLRNLFRALDEPARMENAAVRQALVAHLNSPVPPSDPKFVYDSPHDLPREGDKRRCWLYKADGCLRLVSRFPFDQAREGAERCLTLAEVRVGAAVALARTAGNGAAWRVRQWLDKDRDPEHRLGLYRALFMAGGDTEADRLEARELFTASAAPSSVWIQGLGAMVALFEARGDEPALRVVSSWRLKGVAADMRKAALQAMKAAHPDVYDRILPAGYTPPTRP